MRTGVPPPSASSPTAVKVEAFDLPPWLMGLSGSRRRLPEPACKSLVRQKLARSNYPNKFFLFGLVSAGYFFDLNFSCFLDVLLVPVFSRPGGPLHVKLHGRMDTVVERAPMQWQRTRSRHTRVKGNKGDTRRYHGPERSSRVKAYSSKRRATSRSASSSAPEPASLPAYLTAAHRTRPTVAVLTVLEKKTAARAWHGCSAPCARGFIVVPVILYLCGLSNLGVSRFDAFMVKSQK